MIYRNLELKNDWVWEWTRQYHFILLKKIFSRITPPPHDNTEKVLPTFHNLLYWTSWLPLIKYPLSGPHSVQRAVISLKN